MNIAYTFELYLIYIFKKMVAFKKLKPSIICYGIGYSQVQNISNVSLSTGHFQAGTIKWTVNSYLYKYNLKYFSVYIKQITWEQLTFFYPWRLKISFGSLCSFSKQSLFVLELYFFLIIILDWLYIDYLK